MQPNVFFVKKSEISGRIDPDFYQTEYIELEKKIRQKSQKNLYHFAINMASGGTPSVDEPSYYSDEVNGIPFLRVQNLTTKGILDLTGLKYISREVHESMLKRSQFNDQDLLIKITGVGRMAIASVPPLGFSGNTNQHMIVMKTGNRKISEYLANYLNLNIVEKLAKRRCTGGTRPALDYTALRSIPVIEGLDFSAWEQAKKQAEAKLAQAATLSGSIQAYLLRELGIVVPQVDNALNKRIFTVSTEQLDNRIDPLFYFHQENKMSAGKFENVPLGKIATLDKGTSLNSGSVIDGDYPVIAGGQTSPYNHYVYNFSGENITVSASGAYSGYVWFHDYPIFASDCTVVKGKDEQEILTKFLYEVMKLKQEEIYRLRKGAVQPHVYAVDLEKIQIPLPPLDKQRAIVAHIAQIRAQIAALQQDAANLLADTQREMEHLILG
ncbi:MAG: restriction endonuclease subunit S [[Actinobacillus] rossii]|nr:restriction endonuclease subunit S [[Actinobacillus] rossii]MDY4505116.1 restriction endonuclease subunit S [[Actinobacillus] rossii]